MKQLSICYYIISEEIYSYYAYLSMLDPAIWGDLGAELLKQLSICYYRISEEIYRVAILFL